MIEFVLKEKNFIPDLYKSSIFDINFEELFANGIRLVLIDLDNTLISYDENMPSEEIFNFKNKLISLNMEIIIVSNSTKKRVRPFAQKLGVKFQSFSMKPLKIRVKKAIKKADIKYNKSQIMLVGDQLMTDIWVGKRMKIFTVLVKAIKKKTEIASTRFNRKIEKKILTKIKKKRYHEYLLNLKKYEEENNG